MMTVESETSGPGTPEDLGNEPSVNGGAKSGGRRDDRDAARADLRRALKAARAGGDWSEVARVALDARQGFGRSRFWLAPLLQAGRHVRGLDAEIREACEKVLVDDGDNPLAVGGLLQHHLGNGTEGDVEGLALTVADSRCEQPDDLRSETTKQSLDLLVAAAAVLQATDHSDRAIRCMSAAQRLDREQPKLWFVGARIFSERGEWERLLRLRALAPVYIASRQPMLTALKSAAFLIGEVEACEHLLRKELAKGRSEPLVPLAALLVESGRLGEASAVLERARGVDELDLLVAQANVFLGSAEPARVEQIIAALEPVAPVEALRLRARLASKRQEVELALELWRELAKSGLAQDGLWRGLLGALKQAGESQEAWKLLDQHTSAVPTSINRIDRADLLLSEMCWDQARTEIEPLLDDQRVVLARRRGAMAIAAHIATGSQADPLFLEQMTGRIASEPRRGFSLDASLSKLQVASGDLSGAKMTINTIPIEVETFEADALRSWWAADSGDRRAPEFFERGLARTYRPALHSKRPDLQLLSGEAASVAEHDLVVFAACRDEFLRLPDFLGHYRSLGVEKFVIVDNASNDGSRDFLKQQSDVVLCGTADSYVASGGGMRWINALLDGLRPRRWVVSANIDELAVFAGCEAKSLTEFCNSLDEQGFNAAGGYMLDMHGTQLRDGARYRRGDAMLTTLPLFTNTYDFQPFELSPYENVRGGVRRDFLDDRFQQMTKTPMIRADTGVRFLTSHETTPAVVAKRSVALLHFKLIGDYLDRDQKSLVGPHTLGYSGSDLLAELGLLRPIVAAQR